MPSAPLTNPETSAHAMTLTTANATPLRWGILGCARIARRGLIPGIRASRSGSVAAIASRDGTTAHAWASEFGIPRAHGSPRALVEDPAIDAVYVPLPNELHLPWVLAAADAGKHVLCEKPLALNSAEAATMVDHCRARGVVLMEAFMWRHQPRTAALRKVVADGAIGDLRLIRVSFSFPIDPGDWRLDAARGGGALWDVGSYGLSTARLFAGAEPESVRAVARWGETGVDLSLSASLAFPGGILAAIDCSFEQPFRCTYELVGTLGAIEVPDAFLPPDVPTARLLGRGSPEDHTPRLLRFDGTDQYAEMVDAFAAAVADTDADADGHRLPHPAENGLTQMRGLDAILAAARSS